MNKHELKNFISAFYQAWKDRDEQKAVQFYDKNVKAYVDYQPVTLQDMMDRLEFSKQKFSSAEYIVQDMIIDEPEGKIAIRMDQKYIAKDSPEPIFCKSITLYKIVNKKITEIWMSFYPNVNYLNNDVTNKELFVTNS
ncbi:MAG: hypothetical protein JSR33_03550 [Proteobacteria bacterium]|nr:hypothetical protein [Pseudomonadota bacterium]